MAQGLAAPAGPPSIARVSLVDSYMAWSFTRARCGGLNGNPGPGGLRTSSSGLGFDPLRPALCRHKVAPHMLACKSARKIPAAAMVHDWHTMDADASQLISLREPLMSDPVKVQVKRNGRRFNAQAVLDLAADAATVWSTITDYAALPRFMPGIRACRVVERRTRPPARQGGEQLVVEQEGEFRFLLFAQDMKVTLQIEHEPLRVAHAKATAFDLGLLKGSAIEIFEGRYEIDPAGSGRRSGRVQLHYSATIGLHLPPPPLIGSVAVRQNLEAQLRAVADEITRRQATNVRPAATL